MLLRFCWAALALLLLNGCGRGSEDFTVRIDRPADRVAQVLGHGELDTEISTHISGIKLQRTAPTKNEVVYTLPGDGAFPAVIHLTFEPIEDGKATVVHAAIDMPPVKIALKGKTKTISETKVELAIKELVKKVGSKLEQGSDTLAERKEFAQILTVLGIVSNSKQLRRFAEIESNPRSFMGNWGALSDGGGDYGEDAAQPYGRTPVGVDPAAAVREQEYREKQRNDRAAAPMNDAQGDPARGADPNSY